MIWRLLPLVGILFFVGVVFGWRPWLQRRRHGTWGIVLFRSTRRGDNLRDGMAVLLFVLLVGQAVIWAGWPELLPRLIAVPGPLDVWRAAGAGLLFAGIGFLIA